MGERQPEGLCRRKLVNNILEQDEKKKGKYKYNGAEKSQKKAIRKEWEETAARTSLKARLAEKKAQIAGQSQDTQENMKNKQREI